MEKNNPILHYNKETQSCIHFPNIENPKIAYLSFCGHKYFLKGKKVKINKK